ncbi:hypothetical protein D9Q98_004050 [Chlorella vulgaris]|uniref:Peptidase S74 domain-containing protein n=1 Tax=Chlorella vulgaris TaxID=3077 RepID=A0A9D4TR03_CHLVU|nr:hypothetical protein D9Q98_004050 [Chlorella vulgaris]
MVVRSVYPKFLSNDSGPDSTAASLDTADIANLIANVTSMDLISANIGNANIDSAYLLSVTGTAMHDWLVCNSTSTVVSGTLWSNNVICPTTYSSYFGFGSADRIFAYASSPNQWVQGTSVGDLVVRNMGSNNRFMVGSSEAEGPALSVKGNRVGVKTLDPMSDLHVVGNVLVGGGMTVMGSSSTQLLLQGQGGIGSQCRVDFGTFTDSPSSTIVATEVDEFLNTLDFQTISIEDGLLKSRIFIDGAGSIGLNTNNPAAALHVAGDIRADGGTTLASGMLITDSTTAAANGIQWTSGSYQGALVEKRGSTVDRYGVGVYSGIDYITRMYASGSQSTAKVSVCFPTAESTFLDALVVTRAGANAASITSNVGINTSSPATALHVVGNARVDGSFVASGDVTAFSDRRLKTNLHPVLHSLDKIEQLAGYTYNRVDMPGTYAGLVAQELQQVLPEAVVTGDDGILSVSATSVLALLVQGMKELRSEVAALKGSQQFV